MPPAPGSAVTGIWILAIVAVLFLLRAAAPLLIPIVVAVLISYALEPVVAWLASHRVPRTIGAFGLIGCLVGGLAWGALSLGDDARRVFETLPEVAERTRDLLWSDTESNPARQLERAAQVLQGRSAEEVESTEPDRPTGSRQEDASPDQADASVEPPAGASVTSTMAGLASRGAGSVLALAGHATVVVFLVFFLLVSGHHFRRRLIDVVGSRSKHRQLTRGIIDEINDQIQRFLLVRLVTAIVVGVATWAVLAWLGVEQAAVWGILAGVFNSIPYFGPIVVSGGLFIVGLVQAGDPAHALTMAGAALAITSLEGWLLTPPLLGKAERMHVLVVFLGVLVWTWIWGAWGTILAVPMLVVVKSIADRVEPLKPVGRLMAP